MKIADMYSLESQWNGEFTHPSIVVEHGHGISDELLTLQISFGGDVRVVHFFQDHKIDCYLGDAFDRSLLDEKPVSSGCKELDLVEMHLCAGVFDWFGVANHNEDLHKAVQNYSVVTDCGKEVKCPG